MKALLENIKILDFTALLPGPYATLMMADMGADVLKVSSKSRKDVILEEEPNFENTNKSANLLWLNRNKKTISLNLKTKEAKNIIEDLIKEYDVVIEGFKPGTMKKLGLSYEDLSKINPSLIYCSISSYGQTGPMSNFAGHDINCLSKSGIMSLSGRKNSGPEMLATQVGGLAAANNAVIGILSAINYRNMTGKGQNIDVSLLDILLTYNTFEAASFLVDGELKNREESLLNGGSLYDFYETSDNRYFSVGAIEDNYFTEFCKVINREDLAKGGIFPENVDYVKDEIKKVFKSNTYEHWKNLFVGKDICIMPVQNLDEVFNEDEQVKARDMVIEFEEDNKKLRQIGFPIKFSNAEINYNHPGKEIGSDTFNILKNLGYSKEEIDELEKKDVFK